MTVAGESRTAFSRFSLRLLESCPVIGCGIAATWAGMGLHAEAFRASVWSCLGFVPVLNIFRWLVITLRYGKPVVTCSSHAPLEEVVVDHESGLRSWMSDERIQAKTLYSLVIPGSHDSGAGTCPGMLPYFASWTVCQRLSAFEQLVIGCRFFDLRLTDCGNEEKEDDCEHKERLWISHTVLCTPLWQFLTDVREFIVADYSSKEVIVIQLASDGKCIDHDAWLDTWRTFISVGFDPSEFLNRGDIGKPLSKLAEEGKRVLLLARSCPASDTAEDGMETMKELVDEKGLLFGSWGWTNSNNSVDLERKMESWFDDNAAFFNKFLFKAQCEITPDTSSIAHSLAMIKCNGELHFNLEDASNYANRMLLRRLREGWKERNLSGFITHDFVRADICQAVVDLNFDD